ncbi:MAG TPA: hypothetical protein VK212_02080 [Lentimicrobium sp.]|nr:hypothetical protein [Lentimicrobium sp.]
MKSLLRIIPLLAMTLYIASCTLDEDLGPITGDDRDKFNGTWLFSESPAARSISYSVTISDDPSNSSQVLLKNFGNMGNSYSAYGIVTSNSIYVPSQEMSDGLFVEGEGSLTSADNMSWTYTIEGGGDSENYEATASK